MRYLITFSYDGSKFLGYQKQLEGKTVQGEIEKVLHNITKQDIKIHASGRTDRGVHAYNQKAHFDADINIPVENLKKALNSLLNKEIYVKTVENVSSDFHARFNVEEKIYTYKINLGEFNPLEKDYVYQYNKQLNIDNMKKASKCFIGTKSFKAFAKVNEEITDYVRTIKDVIIKEENEKLFITFIGTGFFRYQVRNMVGALIEVGNDKIKPEKIEEILLSEDRTKAPITASSVGLYLEDVKY